MHGVAADSYCKQNSHNNRKHYFIRRFGLCVSSIFAFSFYQRKVYDEKKAAVVSTALPGLPKTRNVLVRESIS